MRPLWRAALAGAFLLVALFAGSGVAAAHAFLVSTSPARDAQLSQGPDRVTATFNEQLQANFAAMTVVGPDGHLWSTGDTRVQGTSASVAVRPLGPAGTYTVHYRVTSADGHVVSGSWPFQLTVAGNGEPGPTVSGTDNTAPALPRRYADPDGDLPIWPFVAGAIALVGAGLWFNRTRS